MKIRVRDDVDFQAEHLDGWLVRGATYVVLSVEQYSSEELGYRVESEDSQQPVVFRAALFDAIDNRLPACWRVLSVVGVAIELGPAAFGEPGFWENLFDREPAALDSYRRARDEVMANS